MCGAKRGTFKNKICLVHQVILSNIFDQLAFLNSIKNKVMYFGKTEPKLTEQRQI